MENEAFEYAFQWISRVLPLILFLRKSLCIQVNPGVLGEEKGTVSNILGKSFCLLRVNPIPKETTKTLTNMLRD